MMLRLLVFVLLLITGGAFLALGVLRSFDDSSITFAELGWASADSSPTDRLFRHITQFAGDASVLLVNGLDLDLIFYIVLGICAILLALQAIVSAVRLSRMRRLGALRVSLGAALGATHSPPGENSFSSNARTAPAARAIETSFAGPSKRRADSVATGIRTYLGFFARGFSVKMALIFTAVVAIFGLSTMAAVYFTLGKSLTAHALQRATVLAVNAGDSAPPFLLNKNAAALRELLRKLAGSQGVAYALVQDRAGNIFAHSRTVLPPEVESAGSTGEATSGKPRLLRLHEGLVYEVGVPIHEGRIGSVRVALWKEEVDASVRVTVIPLIRWIALATLAGMFLTVFFIWRITHPILRLVRMARLISQGDLDTPTLAAGGSTELAELSRALERMRSSVKAALIRLHQER